MKKNLFYLFALVCAMSLFTACSDDDEDTSWMVFQQPTEFSDSKLEVITNGTLQGDNPVTFTALSATKGTLTFSKIENVALDFTMDVALTKIVSTKVTDTEGYEISGAKDFEPGCTVNVSGTVTTSKMYLEVTTTGYATINKTYQSESLVLTKNGALVDMSASTASVSLKATGEDKINVTLKSIIPGVYVADEDGFDTGYVMEGLSLSKEAGSEVYSFAGKSEYGESEITVEGSVSEDKILTMSVNLEIKSSIVGKWSVKMAGDAADVIAEVATPEQKIVIPDDVYKYVPEDMQSFITKTMTDQQIMGLAKTYLGQYVTYLKSIEFKADGNIEIVYTDINDPTEKTLSGLLNYVIKDDKLQLAPNIAALLGMLMPADTKAYDPNTLLMGGPIPFNFSVDGGELALSVDETVIGPLVGFVNQMIPLIGMFAPDMDPALLEEIGGVLGFVNGTLAAGGVELEVGLKLTK